MKNNYTDRKAKNLNKKDSRCKIATEIKNLGKHKKIVHYLGGQNPSTPFENFFSKGSWTTFIRYELKENTELPNNYLDERNFEICRSINSLLGFAERQNRTNLLEDLQQLKKEIETKFGCFVNANVFHRYKKYVEMFPNEPHYYWLDFCEAPKPDLLQKVLNIVNDESTEDVYATFYMNHRGKDSVKGIINYYGKSLKDRAKSLKSYCEAMLPEKTNVICEVFDTYNNDKAPMAVLKFTKKKKVLPKKTVQEYVLASKRFSNKQLTILWKLPPMKIAGLAAAAKRMKLV